LGSFKCFCFRWFQYTEFFFASERKLTWTESFIAWLLLSERGVAFEMWAFSAKSSKNHAS
jgi:hypothetical protein